MKKIINKLIGEVALLSDPQQVRSATLGLFRIVLQHSCVLVGERLVTILKKYPEKIADYSDIDLTQFVAPSDGGLVQLLSQLLVAAENLGWKTIGKNYWSSIIIPSEMTSLLNKTTANTESLLQAFVAMRNNSGEGHGLPGGYNKSVDIWVLNTIVEKLSEILPVADKNGATLIIPEFGELVQQDMASLKMVSGKLICYRKFKRLNTTKILVTAQIQESLFTRSDFSYECENLLLELPTKSTPQYILADTWDENWSPFIHVPDRLASSDEFTGRMTELNALSEWSNDIDSRVCMIYGDGGVGKTTLVIEFLHRMFEKSETSTWQPELITFYTAKKTRWGLAGLEHISALDVGVSDVAVEIARMFTTERLDRSWFANAPTEIIKKLSNLQKTMKIERNSHLIVLDNTETMAQSDEDVAALAVQIKELSRQVGRVILTSRRRESIAAEPIQIKIWDEDEGTEFLKKRGHRLSCSAINQAGVNTLKKYSKQLGNKPIILEVFAQAASVPGTGLENAFQRVQRMQRQDLGQFLYDDAWGRLSPELRHTLLLMTRVGDSHDDYLMQLCCIKANVTMLAASEAIEESKGIASITKYEGRLEINFNMEFSRFCAERSESIDKIQVPKAEDIAWVKRRYSEFMKVAATQVQDRRLIAYRNPYAKAAWKYFKNRDNEKALQFYEMAELADPDNGAFFERYSYTLFTLRKYDLAYEKAKRATILLPENEDVWFTRGMIEARLAKLEASIGSLQKAEDNGKSKHLCDLQRAYAYVYASPSNKQLAEEYLLLAEKNVPRDNFYSKRISEIRSFKQNWFQ